MMFTAISLVIFMAGPQLYSETYQAITVGLYNDAALMAFALMIAFGLAFPFGTYFAHYFGYIVYFLIWTIAFVVDFLRYDIRTFWMNTPETYYEFLGVGVCIGSVILFLASYFIFLRKSPTERPIGPRTRFKPKYFLRFLVLLSLPGLVLQVFVSAASSVNHRLLFPIAWPPFDGFYYSRVIVCVMTFVAYPVTCYLALRVCLSLLHSIPSFFRRV